MTASDYPALIKETILIKKKRKGGAVNLVLTALFVEAGRMLDEGMDIPSIEAAGRKAFIIPKGFLAQMDDIGIEKVVAAMNALSISSDGRSPLLDIYENFFSAPKSCLDLLDKLNAAEDRSNVRWIQNNQVLEAPKDFLVLELLTKRFQAVAFMAASEVVEAGVAELNDLDSFCRKELLWKEGPFAMMNHIGVEDAVQMVIEKMELSCRKEISFPLPKLLITQAQLLAPWPLDRKV